MKKLILPLLFIASSAVQAQFIQSGDNAEEDTLTLADQNTPSK